MGKIYTSYFANYRNFPDNAYTISTARGLVGGVKADWECKIVAPEASILYPYKRGEINEEEYTTMYKEQLDKIKDSNLFEFIKYIYKLSKEKDVILLCYEKKGKFCHRHILREIINERFKKFSIEEITEL